MVFPLIEKTNGGESDKKASDKKSLLKEYRQLKKEVFPDIPTGLLHGKMPEGEKGEVMHAFVKGELKILFATTVLEVGLDVKKATVMIIESAEHFGLSQLHQLRGRVGRGSKPGYCYLIYSDGVPAATKEKLDTFTTLNDGFALSELDLEIRGPGDFLGQRQSGAALFRIGDLVRDYAILKRAREDAQDELTRRVPGGP